MRITPYNKNFKYCFTSQGYNNNIHKNNKNMIPVKSKKNTVIGCVAAFGTVSALSGILYYILTRGRKIPKAKINKPLVPVKVNQTGILENPSEKFTSDIKYKKLLLQGIQSDVSKPELMQPIAGPEEFYSIVKSFSDKPEFYTPGKSLITDYKDAYDLSNVINGNYRANLHIHTQYSDGKLTVKELLDKSAEYADKIAEKNISEGRCVSHNPFTIAITDHDTLEGCKEAVRIINQNPLKYKNLRVVLGCELTVENLMIPQKLKTPVPIHMLIHGINPFDPSLNSFLDKTKSERVKLVNWQL